MSTYSVVGVFVVLVYLCVNLCVVVFAFVVALGIRDYFVCNCLCSCLFGGVCVLGSTSTIGASTYKHNIRIMTAPPEG